MRGMSLDSARHVRLGRAAVWLIGGLLLAVLPLGPASAQTLPDTTASPDLERLLDDIEEDSGDPTELIEALTTLAEHPLDINAASADDFAQIPWLGPVLARRIVAYRAAQGPFASIPELRQIEGITDDIFSRTRPYLTIGPDLAIEPQRPPRFPAVPRLGTIVRGLRYDVIQRVTRRLDLGRGYQADTSRTTYLGSPERIYTRLQARYNRQVSFNLTLEKDPGEVFEWNPTQGTYGYDHVTLHAALQDVGRVRRLIVGDYSANFGQGLILWGGSAFGKGREPVRPLVRTGTGLRPYGSTNENTFFRGAASTVALTPALALSGFASWRSLDATVLAPDTIAAPSDARIRSLPEDGLHRTPTELSRKDALDATVYGGALAYTHRSTQVGIVGYHAGFAQPLSPDDQPYLRYAFRGQQAALVSLYAHTTMREYAVFGEVARGPDNVWAGIGGLEVYVRGRAEALVLARVYPKDFTSLYGFAFGERNGVTQNESGLYTGLAIRLNRQWRLSAYVDQYRFPWLRFGTPRPTTGHDARVLVEYTPHPWLSLYLQGRTETREEGSVYRDAARRVVEGVRPETRQSLRLQGTYQFSRTLRLRTRAEVARFEVPRDPTAYGLLLYQDVRWQVRPWLRLDARLALFDVDRYDARIYAYEQDLLYTFAVPAFAGQGQRTYVLLHLAPLSDLTLQVKYGSTIYEDAASVGSGLDEVAGNRLREIRMQVRYRF